MITVFTSIVGNKDNLIPQEGLVVFQNAYDKFKSDRRNSRIQKILAHKFIKTEYSIWIDGNLKLLSDPQSLVDKYLNGYDIAVFKHPIRNCLYKEAIECAKRGLDSSEIIIEQVKSYEDEGYPKENGLGENMMILRRHTKKVEQFNNAWWAEYCRFSVRDQLSFMYCADKVGLPVNLIDEQFIENNGRYFRGNIIEIVPHLTEQKIGN